MKTRINKQLQRAQKDTYGLTIIYDTHACLFHDGMQLLPSISSVS